MDFSIKRGQGEHSTENPEFVLSEKSLISDYRLHYLDKWKLGLLIFFYNLFLNIALVHVFQIQFKLKTEFSFLKLKLAGVAIEQKWPVVLSIRLEKFSYNKKKFTQEPVGITMW